MTRLMDTGFRHQYRAAVDNDIPQGTVTYTRYFTVLRLRSHLIELTSMVRMLSPWML